MDGNVTFIGSASLQNYGLYQLTLTNASSIGKQLNVYDISLLDLPWNVSKRCHSLVVFCPPFTQDVALWLRTLLLLCDMRIKNLIIFLDKTQHKREFLIKILFSCNVYITYDHDSIDHIQQKLSIKNSEQGSEYQEVSAGHGRLSSIERSVLRGYLAGGKVADIAMSLGLSQKNTYAFYRKCMDKIGVRNIRALLINITA